MTATQLRERIVEILAFMDQKNREAMPPEQLALAQLSQINFGLHEIAAQLAEHNEREAKQDAESETRNREMLSEVRALFGSLNTGGGDHVAFFVGINGHILPAACSRESAIGPLVTSLAEKFGHRGVEAATWKLTTDDGQEVEWSTPASSIAINGCVNAAPRGSSLV